MLLQATVGRWATETLVFDELLQEPAIGGSSESEAEEVRHSSGRPLSRPPPLCKQLTPTTPTSVSCPRSVTCVTAAPLSVGHCRRRMR